MELAAGKVKKKWKEKNVIFCIFFRIFFCVPFDFFLGSFNRISLFNGAYCGVCVAYSPQCVYTTYIQSDHYDFWRWLRATFLLLVVGITTNFIATICYCCGAKNKPTYYSLTKKTARTKWSSYNNGLPRTNCLFIA